MNKNNSNFISFIYYLLFIIIWVNLLSKYILDFYANKSKYSINYYVKNIFYVLKTGIPWSSLICKSHYSSIYKNDSDFISFIYYLLFIIIWVNLLSKYILDFYANKSKYSINYYVKNIFYVLKTDIPLSSLICKSHYSSIYKKFISMMINYK